MRRLRFGVAGLKDQSDLRKSIDWLVEAGYAACEVQFVKEFTLDEKQCKELGVMARDQGIALSVHGPYFAQLTTKEPERIKLHLGALHHATKLGAQMGARIVVTHPGNRGDASPEELVERVNENLQALGPRVADLGVLLGLETCGRKSQFGTVGDIALVVRNHAFTAPVIDFAHVHAVSNGSMRTPEAFDALFAYITSEFTDEHLSPLHCHFNDNQYSAAGEVRHVPYGDGLLRATNLLEGARGYDVSLTVISESKEASSHAAIHKELKDAGAPLLTLGEREVPSEVGVGTVSMPETIPLEPRGEVHFFKRGPRELRITNLDKVFFPDEEYTKGDLINYYYNAAPLMLSFLRDRPVNMHRVPEGIYGETKFYEKQVPKGAPDWVKTVPVPSNAEGGVTDYVIVDDVTTLAWLAQIASVECHAWTCKWPDLDSPDFAVLDLDPHEPITFEEVRSVAKLVKVLLDRLSLTAFPKTSGGAGLQIFIPLTDGHTYKDVRDFCTGLGQLIVQAYPEKVTLAPSKERRAGKVYVDSDQNAKGQTLVAPYSVRPYPGAPVSMPLTWEELDTDFMPEEFTIASAFDRIAEVGDLFLPALTLKQDLHPALERLRG